MSKRHGFTFWPADWLTDVTVRSWPAAWRGYWIDVLCFMWQEGGSIPDDVELLLRVIHQDDPDDFRRWWNALNGRLQRKNGRCWHHKIRDAYLHNASRKSKNQRAANIRWQKQNMQTHSECNASTSTTTSTSTSYASGDSSHLVTKEINDDSSQYEPPIDLSENNYEELTGRILDAGWQLSPGQADEVAGLLVKMRDPPAALDRLVQRLDAKKPTSKKAYLMALVSKRQLASFIESPDAREAKRLRAAERMAELERKFGGS